MKGFYINLNGRTDRKEHFEKLKIKYPFLSNIERFSAIENLDGALGCCCSHIDSLTLAMDLNEPYVAIFEDDFTILNPDNFFKFIDDFNNIKSHDFWDVIVLTPSGTTTHPSISNFNRIINNQTASGYIIKSNALPILINILTESKQLQLRGVIKNISAIDQYWKQMQLNYSFYYYKDIFAGQLVGWSDIEKRFVDYNDRFMKQNSF